MTTLYDQFGRVLSYLRISVTDRCNFRCAYCMPEEGIELGPKDHLLTFEEIARVCAVGAQLGLRKVRLTGGEPTVRRDLPRLVAMLRALPGIQELAMTTNASRLVELAAPLSAAGLDRLNISLDTLSADKARRITRRDNHQAVLAGIEAAHRCGIPLKFNAVVMRGVNDDELPALARFAHRYGAQMRFIEWMPMGGVVAAQQSAFVSTREMRSRLEAELDLVPEGGLPTLAPQPSGQAAHALGGSSLVVSAPDPARGWVCQKSGVRVGFISSMTDEFCATCNRMRLTAEGGLRPCLHQDAEVPLRGLLRQGASDEELAHAFQRAAGLKWAGHHMTQFIPLYSSKNMVAIGG